MVDNEPTILQLKDDESLKQTSVVMLTTPNIEKIEEYRLVLYKRPSTER